MKRLPPLNALKAFAVAAREGSFTHAGEVLHVTQGAISRQIKQLETALGVPLFNRVFLKTVETFGRTYEIGLITAYKLGTGKLMNDTEKFPTMLKKGKIALLPPRGGDKKSVKRIFRKIKESKTTKA